MLNPKIIERDDVENHYFFMGIMLFAAIRGTHGNEQLLNFIEIVLNQLDKNTDLGVNYDRLKDDKKFNKH